MNAPESDSAQQELELAATAILADLIHAGQLPSQWSYQQVHTVVAIAYGKGYVAGAAWSRELYERGLDRIAEAISKLA